MVKHIILWDIKEEYSQIEKDEIKSNIKGGLEGLKGKIPGLVDIKVYTNGLETSTADLMLDSVFESEKALAEYAKNPLHTNIADTFVRPFTAKRNCLDFEV